MFLHTERGTGCCRKVALSCCVDYSGGSRNKYSLNVVVVWIQNVRFDLFATHFSGHTITLLWTNSVTRYRLFRLVSYIAKN